jgi:hypothetical protein
MPPKKNADALAAGNQLISRFFAGAAPKASPLRRLTRTSPSPSADSTLDTRPAKRARASSSNNISNSTGTSTSSLSTSSTGDSISYSSSSVVEMRVPPTCAEDLATQSAARVAAIATDDFARSLRFATQLASLEDQTAAEDPEGGSSSTSIGSSGGSTSLGSSRGLCVEADGPAAGAKLTPLEGQVAQLKRQHPGLLLCVEVG